MRINITIVRIFSFVIFAFSFVVKVSAIEKQQYLLYSTSATDIRAVPLKEGGLPDLNIGIDIIASAYCEDDFSLPARLTVLSDGQFLVRWANNDSQSCYSRFVPDVENGFIETRLGG